MNHSKPGLNEPFYKWLDDVRRAIRKEKELKEKLAYYNVKLIGYKGVVYDRIGSAGTAGSEKDMYYWMDMIRITEMKLTREKKVLNEYLALQGLLDDEHRHVLQDILSLRKDTFGRCSRHYLLNGIIRVWINAGQNH